ncbi:MAG TPA: Clp protease N-terminal domain-containing protein [Planctomycetota bacterium]|nr:Clp protease N-terminal domain-containing protein [Planctomycetota bacterium]
MARELDAAPGGDAAEILQLAELEARRMGAKEVEVRHLALALTQHPRWRAPFAELGLTPKQLRAALFETPAKDAEAMPQAQELAEVVRRARKFLPSQDAPFSGGHLLRAILEGEGAVAQTLSRESGVSLFDLLNKPELLRLPVKLSRIEGMAQRLNAGLRHLGRWTVRAFAWAAIWAFVLFYVAGWVLGRERGHRWFPWLLLAAGAGCALGLAIERALKTVRRREHGAPASAEAKPK